MSKKYFCLIAALLAFPSGGLLLCSVPASAIAALPESSHISSAGTTLTVEAQSNTTEAKRLELRHAIDQSGPKGSRKTGEAITELIKIENPDDIIYLLGMMNKNKETPLEVQIKKAILAYPNNTFIAIALKKAGQDFDADINIIAANLLIDKGEKSQALMTMTALIKKGVLTRQIIDIIERVPNRKELVGKKSPTGEILYGMEIEQQLAFISGDATLPMDVRMFSTLITAAYYGCFFSKENILPTLQNAGYDYQLEAVKLLEKATAIGANAATPYLILKALQRSHFKEISQKATNICNRIENERKLTMRKIVTGETKTHLENRLEVIQYYLDNFGDEDEEVEFLLGVLQKEKDSDVKRQVVSTIGSSKHFQMALKKIIQISEENVPAALRLNAIYALIRNKQEQSAFESLWKYINEEAGHGKIISVDIFDQFGEGYQAKTKKMLEKLYANNSELVQVYAALCLLNNCGVMMADYQSETLQVMKTNISEDNALFIMMELSFIAARNIKIRPDILELVNNIKEQCNPALKDTVDREWKKIIHSGWWKEWQKRDK
jgi:hypothetical protein